MADVSIDSTISTASARAVRSSVWVSDTVGYQFYTDSTGAISYSKTTDGGGTWGAAVQAGGGFTTEIAFDVWYDRWTPYDNGTLIHIWYFDSTNDTVQYRAIDTADSDRVSQNTTVVALASAVAGRGAFISGTKTKSGYLYCAFDIDAGAERGFYRAVGNNGQLNAGWTSLSSTFVEATLDTCLLFPDGTSTDWNDCWAVYYDASATALTLKQWDSSAATAVESSTIQTHTDGATDLTGQWGYSATLRLSDGHLLLAAVSLRDNASSAHQVFDITNTSTFSTKTNITTNIDDHYFPQIFINQVNNDIYVAYNGKRDGSEVLDTTTKVYYTKSTDGGTSWTAGDTAYMEGATAAVQQLFVSPMGPRFYVAWRTGTTLNGNKVSSLTFAVTQYVGPDNTLAPYAVIDTYASSNVSTTLSFGTLQGRSQSFLGTGRIAVAVRFSLDRTATGGFARAAIYATTGTHGTNAIPSGGPIAASLLVNITSNISGSAAMVTYVLESPVLLAAGTTYAVAFETGSPSGGQVFLGVDASSPTHGGNSATASGTLPWTWTADATQDVIFDVYTVAGVPTLYPPTLAYAVGLTPAIPVPTAFTEGSAIDAYYALPSGQVLQTGGTILRAYSVWLRRGSATTTGSITIKVYLGSATSVNSVPTGSVLATSEAIDASELPVASNAAREFTFAFTGANCIPLDLTYAMVVDGPADVSLAGHSELGATTNMFTWTGGAWAVVATHDAPFRLYGTSPLYLTPTVEVVPFTAPSISSRVVLDLHTLEQEHLSTEDYWHFASDTSKFAQDFHVAVPFAAIEVLIGVEAPADTSLVLEVRAGSRTGTILATSTLVEVVTDPDIKFHRFYLSTVIDPGGISTAYSWVITRTAGTAHWTYLAYGDALTADSSWSFYHGDSDWTEYEDFTYLCRVLGPGVFAPTVAHAVGGDQAVTGGTVASTALAQEPSLAYVIALPTRASTVVLTSPGTPAVSAPGAATLVAFTGDEYSQSFTNVAGPLLSCTFSLKYSGSAPTSALQVELRQDTYDGTVLATSGSYAETGLTTSFQTITFTFAAPFTLVRASTYHLRFLRTPSDAVKTINPAGSVNGYSGGALYISGAIQANSDLTFSLNVYAGVAYEVNAPTIAATTVLTEPAVAAPEAAIVGHTVTTTAVLSPPSTAYSLQAAFIQGSAELTVFAAPNFPQVLTTIGGGDAYGQSFTVSRPFQAISLNLLRSASAPDGNIVVEIWTGPGTGSILASGSLAASGLSTAFAFHTFQLDARIVPSGATTYYVGVYRTGTLQSVDIGGTLGDIYAGSYYEQDSLGEWIELGGLDLHFRVESEQAFAPTVALAVTAGTVATTTALTPPTVAPPTAAVTGHTIASTVTTSPPTLAYAVTTGPIGENLDLLLEDGSGLLLEDGGAALLEEVGGAAVLFAPTVALAGAALLEVQVFETVTVAEAAHPAVTPDVARPGEAVAVLDVVTAQVRTVRITAAVADAVAVTENQKAVAAPVIVRPVETTTVTDVVAPQLRTVRLTVTAAETITVAENRKAVATPLAVHAADAVTVTDAVTPLLRLVRIKAAVAETITVAEFRKAVLPQLAVHASESVLTEDALNVGRPQIAIRPTELVTVADVPKAVLSPLTVRVADAVTVTDVRKAVIPALSVRVAETITVAEFRRALIPALTVRVADAVTVAEQVTTGAGAFGVARSDSVTVADVATVQLQTVRLTVLVADAVGATDAPRAVEPQLAVHATEAVTVADVPLLLVPTLTVLVWDDLTAADTVTAVLALPGTRYAVVADEVTVTEAVMVALTPSAHFVVCELRDFGSLDHLAGRLVGADYEGVLVGGTGGRLVGEDHEGRLVGAFGGTLRRVEE